MLSGNMMQGRLPHDRQISELRRRLNDVFDVFSDPFFRDPLQSSQLGGFGPGFGNFGMFPTMFGTSALPLLSSGMSSPSTSLTMGGTQPSTSSWLSPWTTGAISDVNVPIVDLPLDVTESDKEMTLKADVPGMDKSNFNIRVNGDVLEIECHREEEKASGEETNRIRERRFGKAIRSMRLPDNIDTQSIKSEYQNGVLCLHLPKTRPEPSNVKRIEIQ